MLIDLKKDENQAKIKRMLFEQFTAPACTRLEEAVVPVACWFHPELAAHRVGLVAPISSL